jgi:sugar phosphate isomerase/epimerase
LKLACQEHLLPGNTLSEKRKNAKRYGFEAIELRGFGYFVFRDRLPELREAKKAGAVFSSVCVIMDHFIGDFCVDKRCDAIMNMKSLLTVIAEMGGVGAITSAAYGLHSNYLPPFKAKRSPEEDREVLLECLHELGNHARSEGVKVLFEPLNRYEDHMRNTLAQSVDLLKALKHPNVALMADLFHMNIDEPDISASLEKSIKHVAHIHIADSNRYEPGEGHTDFKTIFKTPKRLKYDGYIAFECMLKKKPETALKTSVRYLQGE